MADKVKELKSLSRGDLLELLLAQTERAEQMERELADAKRRAESREIVIAKAGTLAEAAMQINQVWQAADQAAAQYLSNVMRMYEEQLEKNEELEREYAQRKQELLGDSTRKCEEMERESRRKCEELERETKARCDEMLQKAKTESEAYWNQVYSKLEQYCAAQESLKAILQMKG